MTPRRERALVALAKGNEIKHARQQARRRLAAGEITFAQALVLDCCQGARVLDVLTWLPGVGLGRAERRMAAAGLRENRLVRELTARQVAVLAGEREAA